MVGIKILHTSLNFHRIVAEFSVMVDLRQFLLVIATYIGNDQIGQYTEGWFLELVWILVLPVLISLSLLLTNFSLYSSLVRAIQQ